MTHRRTFCPVHVSPTPIGSYVSMCRPFFRLLLRSSWPGARPRRIFPGQLDDDCGSQAWTFKSDVAKAQQNTKRRWDRYKHYFTTRQGHVISSEQEAKLRLELGEKKAELESKQFTHDGSQPFDGFEQLLAARELLAHSYIFAFYMFVMKFPRMRPSLRSAGGSIRTCSRINRNSLETLLSVSPHT
eukprot:scaffold625_cov420-Prasinococcus_capsulatus_cf.AAC.51